MVFFVTNKLNGSILKVKGIQEEGFRNSRGNEGKYNDVIGNWWGDKYRHERQHLTLSPIYFETKICWDKYHEGHITSIN